MKILNVLIGCEESQAVAIAFRNLGHNAFSCDLKPCSGGHPEFHIQDSIFNVLENQSSFYPVWDLFIGHPPCTRTATR